MPFPRSTATARAVGPRGCGRHAACRKTVCSAWNRLSPASATTMSAHSAACSGAKSAAPRPINGAALPRHKPQERSHRQAGTRADPMRNGWLRYFSLIGYPATLPGEPSWSVPTEVATATPSRSRGAILVFRPVPQATSALPFGAAGRKFGLRPSPTIFYTSASLNGLL